MRIVILAQEEPAFMGPTLIEVIEKKSKDIDFVVLFGLREGAKKPKKISEKIERFLVYLIIFGFLGSIQVLRRRIIYYLMKNSKRRKDFYSIKRVCKRLNIPVHEFTSMNNHSFKELMKIKNVDIVLNQSDYIIPEDIILTTKRGIINRHGSLLPKHKGRMASYWSHVEGREYGITIHFLTKEIDSGDIILQRKLNLSTKDSYYNIINKIFKESSCIILEAFSLLENTSFKPKPMDKINYKKNEFPTLKESLRHRKMFRKRRQCSNLI